MTITDERLAELRRLFSAATKGQWRRVGGFILDESGQCIASIINCDGDTLANGAAIAAANPATVLGLVVEVERLRAVIADEIKRLDGPGGSTHWEGCERSHPRCAAIKRLRAALTGAKS